MNENKKYEPFKIPVSRRTPENGAGQTQAQRNLDLLIAAHTQRFAEIVIEDERKERMAEILPSPEAIKPAADDKRALFVKMRQLARENQTFYTDHSKAFYKQAVFMKDFEDDYADDVPFSSYFPYYQLMSYEQLRTYFTWRANVRGGVINKTSLSYAFVYIYELLGNVGVDDPQEGLEKLVAFWRDYGAHDGAVGRYLIKWVKDYHVYYELEKPFEDFARDNGVLAHYPNVFGYRQGDGFDFFCGISKYNIKRSVFYGDDRRGLIEDCFNFVADRLERLLREAGTSFNELIFQPVNEYSWTPFGQALFYPWLNQPDRRVEFSPNEYYVCHNNRWTCSSMLLTESGRELAGYIMKQTESAMRKALNFKYKLSANPNMLRNTAFKRGGAKKLPIEKIINDAVAEYYAEINRKPVSVDAATLERIRRDALHIQQKLIVPDTADAEETGETIPSGADIWHNETMLSEPHEAWEEPQAASARRNTDIWQDFFLALTETERAVLSAVLRGGDVRAIAGESGVMTEVLIDGINQKAYDITGDNIFELDGEAAVYEEYREKLEELAAERDGHTNG